MRPPKNLSPLPASKSSNRFCHGQDWLHWVESVEWLIAPPPKQRNFDIQECLILWTHIPLPLSVHLSTIFVVNAAICINQQRQLPKHVKDYICLITTTKPSKCLYPISSYLSYQSLSPNHKAYGLFISTLTNPPLSHKPTRSNVGWCHAGRT